WESSSEAEMQRMLRAIHLAGASFWWPGVNRQVYVDERDVVLAHALKNAPGERVVGVVGLAHLAGIQRNWVRKTSEVLPYLFEEPPRWLLPQVVGAGLVASFPLCMRIRGFYRRRAACTISLVLAGSFLGNTGRFSFFS
ncbi:unnamed protein product, partial [Polarella glacialis]